MSVEFSYIIVNFRTSKLTLEAVTSIINHEKKTSHEIIVVENGSDDDSEQFLKKYLPEHVKLIISDTNIGFGRANNLGLKNARGRFFVIFNSDAYEVEEILPKIKSKFESDKRISILGTKLVYPNYHLQQSHGSLPGIISIFTWMFFLDDIPIIRSILPSMHKRADFFYRKSTKTGWVTGALMVVKRSVYTKLGGFNPDIFLYGEDVDFCLRADKKKFKTYFTPDVKVVHIGQQSSKGQADTALINEFKGLRYVSKYNFNPIKYFLIKVILIKGALIRLVIFGIILKRKERKSIYTQALKAIW